MSHANSRNMKPVNDPNVPIIELQDAEVIFTTRAGSGLFHKNRITAVNKVNLKLMPGQTIGIVGESGCGKSTTANIMCGLQQVTSGTVLFKGHDVTHRTAKERMEIGRVVSVVFQDPATALNARMRVIDQLIDPLVVHHLGSKAERDKRARELIRMVGLPSQVLGALPGQLSGGQRQRVAICRALIMHPRIMLFDEVTAALDPEMVREVLDVIVELADQGLTMMIVTHEMAFARAVADRIVLLDGGKLVEQSDDAEAFFTHPQTERAQQFLQTFAFERGHHAQNLDDQA